jgi:uncharacterized protein
MAMRKVRPTRARFWAMALAVVAVSSMQPLNAQAQFFGGGWGNGPQYGHPPPQRGYFSFPFFNRPSSPYGSPSYAPPPESYRAPPPRKLENTPANTIVVVGDSMADWLGYGLEEIYADNPQVGIVRHVRLNSGLIHYEPRNDTLEWSQAIKDVLATEKPAAIVVMLGLNDRLPLRSPLAATRETGQKPAQAPSQQGKGGKAAAQPEAAQNPDGEEAGKAETAAPRAGVSYEFRSDEWAKLYAKRIDDMIAALKSKGVPVLWVGLPAIRGPHATSDMDYLDDLYNAAADKAGITYVDIWDGFVDENGRYAVEGPDFEGQIRRLRSSDGVHFTKYGALKLAHLVDQELSRALANPMAPATVPSPEASAPAKPGATRPAIGPVLPLTTSGGSDAASSNGLDGGNLLGAGGQPAPIASEDPTARSVLVRGDALPAQAGRADDFAWPPPGGDTNTPPRSAPAPAAIH